jgi:hypothetical protein
LERDALADDLEALLRASAAEEGLVTAATSATAAAAGVGGGDYSKRTPL